MVFLLWFYSGFMVFLMVGFEWFSILFWNIFVAFPAGVYAFGLSNLGPWTGICLFVWPSQANRSQRMGGTGRYVASDIQKMFFGYLFQCLRTKTIKTRFLESQAALKDVSKYVWAGLWVCVHGLLKSFIAQGLWA